MREIALALLAFFRFFLPPKSSAPEEKQLSWRYKVASTLASLVVVFILGSLLALGQFAGVSKGFAMVDQEDKAHNEILDKINKDRSDIAALKGVLWELREGQLDTSLYDIRGRQCAAELLKNAQALHAEGERLREARPRYHTLTGEDWRIPPCIEY